MCVFRLYSSAVYPGLLRKTTGHRATRISRWRLSPVWTSRTCPQQKQLQLYPRNAECALLPCRGARLKPPLVISVYGTFMHTAHFSQRAVKQHLCAQLLWAIRSTENYAQHNSLYLTSGCPEQALWIKGKIYWTIFMWCSHKWAESSSILFLQVTRTLETVLVTWSNSSHPIPALPHFLWSTLGFALANKIGQTPLRPQNLPKHC